MRYRFHGKMIDNRDEGKHEFRAQFEAHCEASKTFADGFQTWQRKLANRKP